MRNVPNGEQPAYGFAACTGEHPASAGLTKRELLAGMAMQGIMANGDFFLVRNIKEIAEDMGMFGFRPHQIAARMATECADHLLSELAKEQP